ncbi:hypothetical protein ACFWU5_16585 [Nocardia sp. NPDC058640]|uniref:hypothetical protein n=1 Tax=Nocardia sp. NPDC058640 TaxID=3346571 RepID=UPI003647397E
MSEQLDLTAALKSRVDVTVEIARLWRKQIAEQPMSLVADDGMKVLALSELTIRILEEAGWSRS